MLDTLIDLARRPEFLAGLISGLLVLLVALTGGAWWRSRYRSPAPISGLLLAGGTLLALTVFRVVAPTIWIAVGLLAVAGAVVDFPPVGRAWRLPAGVLGSAPGAFLLAFSTRAASR